MPTQATESVKYARCARCGTWRPKPATVKDDSGPLGLQETVCKDTRWCYARAQETSLALQAVEAEIHRRG